MGTLTLPSSGHIYRDTLMTFSRIESRLRLSGSSILV